MTIFYRPEGDLLLCCCMVRVNLKCVNVKKNFFNRMEQKKKLIP